MNTLFLLMWLEAPLQSWGFDSIFSRRDTLSFPTKSGILGLLCCSLGAAGEQRQLLGQMAPLKTTVIAFSRNGEKHFGEPLLQDFHMVGAGYDDKNSFEKLMIPKKIDGKSANGGIKLTYRYYLQDVAFAVALEVPVDLSKSFSEALQNPVWDLYLGRKNCVPTDFIYRGIYSQECDAITHGLEIAKEKSLYEDFRVFDGEHDGEVLVLNDVPMQFGEKKKYGQRHVTVVKTKP
jgi:CRISPR system Cascade subunit CasD